MNDVDFAVFLRFFGRLLRPRAGDHVVGALGLFQPDQVERDGAELPRAAALQEHHLVVVWDFSAERNKTKIVLTRAASRSIINRHTSFISVSL